MNHYCKIWSLHWVKSFLAYLLDDPSKSCMFDTFYVSVTCLGKNERNSWTNKGNQSMEFCHKKWQNLESKEMWNYWARVLHTCQPPEYKNLEMSRNLCIVRMSLRYSERLGDLMKKLGDSRENRESWRVWYSVNYHSYNKERVTAEYPATSKVLPWRVWIRGYEVAKTTLSLEIIQV